MWARVFRSHAEWKDWLHTCLARPELPAGAPRAIDLFAGCGGLALGFEAAGIRTAGYEMKEPAVRTYSTNLDGDCEQVVLDLGMPECDEDEVE